MATKAQYQSGTGLVVASGPNASSRYPPSAIATPTSVQPIATIATPIATG